VNEGGTTEGLRRQLRSSVVDSAAPYGYTLTIFANGSVAEYMIGKPHVFEVLLLIAGAVAGFLAIELIAYGHLTIRLSKPDSGPEEIWGHAHLLSAGISVLVCWAFLQALSTNAAWLVVGFLATAVYLLVNAVQGTLASRSAE
jgi:MFS family permease